MNNKHKLYIETTVVLFIILGIFSFTIGYFVPKAFKERQESLEEIKVLYKCDNNLYTQDKVTINNEILVINSNDNTTIYCHSYEIIQILK